MSRAREAARLANKQILTVSTGNDKLGIGSTSPVTKLDVDGNITADEVFSQGVNVVSVGVTNLSVSGVATFSNNVDLGDGDILRFGEGADLQIYHNGSNSYIQDSGTGSLIFKSDLYSFRNDTDTEQLAKFIEDGAVELYYDNSKKFETTGYGVTITGGVYASGISTSDSTFNIKPSSDVRALVIDSANLSAEVNKHITLIGPGPNGIDFRDQNDSDGLKLVFRTSPNQLKIENSEDTTAYFTVDRDDGQVQLNYGGSGIKLATTSGGINVTGVVTATEFSGDTITFSNLEKSNIFNDGELGFDSSQGLLLRRTQQGVSGATVTVLDGANVSAGSGMSITNLGSGDSGTGQIVFAVDLSTYAITSNQLLTLTNATTCINASGHIVSGKGSGGAALTINDGHGNANVTFNHLAGVPEQVGNALRIETNTDSTSNPTFNFEGKAAPSANVSLSLTTMMTLSETDGLSVSANGGRINCGQIMFDDGNASLDDYEEGTWTPSYSATGLSISSYDQRNGGYVKIGNVVYIWGRLRTDGLSYPGGNSTSNVIITGLPYRNINDVNYRGGLHVNYALNFNALAPLSGLMSLNNTTISLYGRDITGMLDVVEGIHQLKNEDMRSTTNSNNIYFWGTYYTDQGN